MLDTVSRDIRFALRNLTRRKRAMGLAIFTFALGIGASTAMYSVVNSVLMKPLPFPDSDELVAIYLGNPQMEGHPTLGQFAERGTFAWPELWALRDGQSSLDGFAGYGYRIAVVNEFERPERHLLGQANYELFATLGVQPIVGRLFTEEEGEGRSGNVILLTESFWRERFGADPSIVGSALRIGDSPYSIVGVLPSDGRIRETSEIGWTPRIRNPEGDSWGSHNDMVAVGRLKDGVTLEQAREDLTRTIRAALPPEHADHTAKVFPLLDDQVRTVRPALIALLSGALLLLLVGCGNVAAILLGVGIDRESEIAVRGALGATRGRVVRQLLTESGILAGIGGVVGFLFSGLTLRGLVYLAPPGIPRIDTASVDMKLFGFALVLAAATGLLFGLIPSLNLASSARTGTLRGTRGVTRGRSRLMASIVVGELALATVLLVSGVLLGRSLIALDTIETGYDLEKLAAARVTLPGALYRNESDSEPGVSAYRHVQMLMEGLRTLPGVEAVANTSVRPLTSDRNNNTVLPEGWVPKGDEVLVAERRFVSAGFFEVMGIDLVDGRGIGPDDDVIGAPRTVVISESLADHAWPGESAIGRRMYFWERDFTVIGVAADLRDETLQESTGLAIYVPTGVLPSEVGGNLMIRSSVDPETLVQSIRTGIAELDPSLPLATVVPVKDYAAGSLDDQRYRARLMIVFALLAGILAITGIYGVTSRSVARRTREIGIRVALGAETHRVVAEVMTNGLRLALLGCLIGLVLSLFSGRWIEDLLFDVTVSDPVTLMSIAVAVGLGSLLASYAPSRRAATIDPSIALQAE